MEQTLKKNQINAWTADEENFLISNYHKMTQSELAKKIRRTPAAIYTRARDLGITKFRRSGGNNKPNSGKKVGRSKTSRVFTDSYDNNKKVDKISCTVGYYITEEVSEVVMLAKIISENQWIVKYLK